MAPTHADARTIIRMARIRRQIEARLKQGASLSSPRVVALSRRLDQLVLALYRGA
ncbi:MAG TPA: hypothetical protein VD902_08235 [Symbiobacteriaceae bacterium]|nr:hypothetical protein [Symbiobacteriaceae bacterium]